MAVCWFLVSGPLRRLGLLLSLAMLVACATGAETGYIHAKEPIGTVRAVYDGALFPDIQVNTFRNIDRLFPTRIVKRGTVVYPLPVSDTPLQNFRFASRGQEYDLYDFVSLNRVSGLLVIKDADIVFEEYFLGNSEQTRWMSMSVAKSVTAMLVGAAIKDGYIQSIDDAVTDYLPRFRGSAYEGVTVRQLLQMSSGVAWNETYTDPQSDRRRMLDAQIGQRAGAILDLMAELPRAANPGTRWNYSTGETHVVGALVRAATGMPIADYLSDKIWARLGMESDASWWLESPDGLEVGGSGLSATLRDYGRFGLLLLNDGVINGESILPEGWVRNASTPTVINGEQTEYGYMLWPLGSGTYAAIGIFGQFIYVNPARNLVVAMWGAQSKPVGRDVVDEYEFFAALSDAVP